MTNILMRAPLEISRQMLFRSSMRLMAATPMVAAKKVRPLERMLWLQYWQATCAASLGDSPFCRSSLKRVAISMA